MRIGIAGLGLIGGSLALALRDRHEVTGFDVDRATRELSSASGIATMDRLDGLLPADAIIIATPLDAVLPTLAALVPAAGGTVLADVSSVRGPVDAFARAQRDGVRIVGMHPMAGRTAHGFAAADAALLSGRPFLIVPTIRADAAAMRVVGQIARDAGGEAVVCSAAEHDRIVAVTSALPLVLAAALSIVGSDVAPGLVASFAGPGFRDATRLAQTPLDLSEALVSANGGNVVAAIARLRTVLDEIERATAERDAPALRALLQRAASARVVLG